MEEDISVLGNMDSGSVVEYKNNEYVYTSVFILTQEEKHDFILDEGMYCTYTYSGEYDRTNQLFNKMQDWIKEHNYTVDGPFLEFLLIDIHETKKWRSILPPSTLRLNQDDKSRFNRFIFFDIH